MIPLPGEVYRVPSFVFNDGESAPKYAVVLGDATRLRNDRDDHVLVIVTTKQGRHFRSKAPGCHADEYHPHFFIATRTTDIFTLDTHVVIDDIYRMGCRELDSKAAHKGSLPIPLSLEIVDCVLSADIEPIYREALARYRT